MQADERVHAYKSAFMFARASASPCLCTRSLCLPCLHAACAHTHQCLHAGRLHHAQLPPATLQHLAAPVLPNHFWTGACSSANVSMYRTLLGYHRLNCAAPARQGARNFKCSDMVPPLRCYSCVPVAGSCAIRPLLCAASHRWRHTVNHSPTYTIQCVHACRNAHRGLVSLPLPAALLKQGILRQPLLKRHQPKRLPAGPVRAGAHHQPPSAHDPRVLCPGPPHEC